jgi:hypothetical protein
MEQVYIETIKSDESRGIWKETVVTIFMQYHSIILEGLRKATKNVRITSFRPGFEPARCIKDDVTRSELVRCIKDDVTRSEPVRCIKDDVTCSEGKLESFVILIRKLSRAQRLKKSNKSPVANVGAHTSLHEVPRWIKLQCNSWSRRAIGKIHIFREQMSKRFWYHTTNVCSFVLRFLWVMYLWIFYGPILVSDYFTRNALEQSILRVQIKVSQEVVSTLPLFVHVEIPFYSQKLTTPGQEF